MIHWVVRLIWASAGVITGWFVAREATNFAWIQIIVSLLLMTLFLALAVYWPSLVRCFSRKREPEPRP
jgi:hypothetical protein